ncbi:ankyrin [Nostoc linckia z16]|nr:ankyrin [Nostoc linckia z16]
MKKTIIYLAVALVSFSAASVASTVKSSTAFEAAYKATPLATAISKGDVDAVKKFIEYGADVNERSNGITPLMLAARYNNVEIINLLVASGANLKAKDDKGYTALKYAEQSNAQQAVESLKKAMAA